jgi:hypothetical protein
MPLRERTSLSLILSLAALALAMLAGAVIALAGGRGDASTLSWTPPAPTVPPATPLPKLTATSAPTRQPTVPPTPTSTATRVRPTETPAPTATPAQTVAATVAPVARILQGPANLRAGPGTDFGVARVANEGETYEATGRTADGAWLRLCCVDGAPVWVAGELVELPAGAGVPVVNP